MVLEKKKDSDHVLFSRACECDHEGCLVVKNKQKTYWFGCGFPNRRVTVTAVHVHGET